jgi:hypothetical protein
VSNKFILIIITQIQNHPIVLITLAGTPATTVLGGTSLVTTAPAATTEFSPIVTALATKKTLKELAKLNYHFVSKDHSSSRA